MQQSESGRPDGKKWVEDFVDAMCRLKVWRRFGPTDIGESAAETAFFALAKPEKVGELKGIIRE